MRFKLNLVEEDLTARKSDVEKNVSVGHEFISHESSAPIRHCNRLLNDLSIRSREKKELSPLCFNSVAFFYLFRLLSSPSFTESISLFRLLKQHRLYRGTTVRRSGSHLSTDHVLWAFRKPNSFMLLL